MMTINSIYSHLYSHSKIKIIYMLLSDILKDSNYKLTQFKDHQIKIIKVFYLIS